MLGLGDGQQVMQALQKFSQQLGQKWQSSGMLMSWSAAAAVAEACGLWLGSRSSVAVTRCLLMSSCVRCWVRGCMLGSGDFAQMLDPGFLDWVVQGHCLELSRLLVLQDAASCGWESMMARGLQVT